MRKQKAKTVKSCKNLYPQVWAWDNLYRAYRKARRGKRARAPAAVFGWDLEGNLVRLQDELAAKTYHPGPYDSFYIHEPKRRLISAASFRNRVAHHALCNVIEPIFGGPPLVVSAVATAPRPGAGHPILRGLRGDGLP